MHTLLEIASFLFLVSNAPPPLLLVILTAPKTGESSAKTPCSITEKKLFQILWKTENAQICDVINLRHSLLLFCHQFLLWVFFLFQYLCFVCFTYQTVITKYRIFPMFIHKQQQNKTLAPRETGRKI